MKKKILAIGLASAVVLFAAAVTLNFVVPPAEEKTSSTASVPSSPEPLDSNSAMALVIQQVGHCAFENTCAAMEIAMISDDIIEVVKKGVYDDSISDVRLHYRAVWDAEKGWQVGEPISTEYICREGRGQTEFGTEMCL